MCWRMFVRSCFNLKDEDSHWETVDGQDDKFLAQKKFNKKLCYIGFLPVYPCKAELRGVLKWIESGKHKQQKNQ